MGDAKTQSNAALGDDVQGGTLAKGTAAISSAYSYLVTPDKNAENRRLVQSAGIPLSCKLFDMLAGVFAASDAECDVPIRFTPADSGTQTNVMRDQVLAYLAGPTEHRGLKIAEALRNVTTERSGLGLLFLLHGRESKSNHKIVISRFPADQGVVADPVAGRLQIAFIERVFMKNAHAYKAALYAGNPTPHTFWDGHAVDKQMNSGVQAIAAYWIRAFLQSDLKTTSKAGTKRLAESLIFALRKAPNLSVKQELTAAITLASRSMAGKTTSVVGFCQSYNLSGDASTLVSAQLANSGARTDKFVFDVGEFQSRARLRAISLDNGAVLTAEAEKFDQCFEQSRPAGRPGIRFTTEGVIVDDKIKGR